MSKTVSAKSVLNNTDNSNCTSVINGSKPNSSQNKNSILTNNKASCFSNDNQKEEFKYNLNQLLGQSQQFEDSNSNLYNKIY
jgi:hypothetical protein